MNRKTLLPGSRQHKPRSHPNSNQLFLKITRRRSLLPVVPHEKQKGCFIDRKLTLNAHFGTSKWMYLIPQIQNYNSPAHSCTTLQIQESSKPLHHLMVYVIILPKMSLCSVIDWIVTCVWLFSENSLFNPKYHHVNVTIMFKNLVSIKGCSFNFLSFIPLHPLFSPLSSPCPFPPSFPYRWICSIFGALRKRQPGKGNMRNTRRHTTTWAHAYT